MRARVVDMAIKPLRRLSIGRGSHLTEPVQHGTEFSSAQAPLGGRVAHQV